MVVDIAPIGALPPPISVSLWLPLSVLSPQRWRHPKTYGIILWISGLACPLLTLPDAPRWITLKRRNWTKIGVVLTSNLRSR